ncbi:MAG: phosphate signaling complex protein PhoU [Verrucomicrobiota bacterium]|jgi:phosphate transport system protein
MELHFDQELTQAKDLLLRMSSLAEQAVAMALKGLVQRDDALAQQVHDGDTQLDCLQKEIDERCIELVALRQPKARDLRFLIVIMKIAAELERVGDQAVNIAHRAMALNQEPQLKPFIDIPRMSDMSCGMIRTALDALVYGKSDVAEQVIRTDDEVDQLEIQLHRELTSFMLEAPQTITRAMNLIGVAHSLERIGDHAVNIAEEVVYLYEGRDIRHQSPNA